MLALTIERLYRLRYLHRGKHRVPNSAQLLLLLWSVFPGRVLPTAVDAQQKKTGRPVFLHTTNTRTQ